MRWIVTSKAKGTIESQKEKANQKELAEREERAPQQQASNLNQHGCSLRKL